MQRQQHWTRRAHDRFELFECAMIFRTEDGSPIRAMIVDIGLGGVQLRSREPMKSGQSCFVKVGRDKGAPFIIRAEVRHSSLLDETGLYATGVRFTPQTPEERKFVARYMNSAVQTKFDV